MTGNVVAGPNSSAALSLDELPISALQAIYHAVTGKTENLKKNLQGSVLIEGVDFENLYLRLKQQIEHLTVVTTPTVTVSLKTSDARTIRHSSWEHFKGLQTNDFAITSEVFLTIELLMNLPNIEAPQRMTINVTLDSALPLIAPEDEAMADTSLLDFLIVYGENWRTCKISIDFVDFLIAQRFQSTVEEWFKILRRMPKAKLNSWLVRHWRLLRDSVDASPLLGLTAFVGAYGWSHPAFPRDAAQIASPIWRALLMMAILKSLRGQAIVVFMRRLSHNIVPTVILLTTGDNRRYASFK